MHGRGVDRRVTPSHVHVGAAALCYGISKRSHAVSLRRRGAGFSRAVNPWTRKLRLPAAFGAGRWYGAMLLSDAVTSESPNKRPTLLTVRRLMTNLPADMVRARGRL